MHQNAAGTAWLRNPAPWRDLPKHCENGSWLTIWDIRPDGKKKAFARLTPDVDALDIAATKLAIV